MFSLLNALRHQQLSGSSNRLQSYFNQLFDENIRNNIGNNQIIQTTGRLLSMSCCGDFIAVLDSHNMLSLYNISIFRKCWSIQVVPVQDYVFLQDAVLVNDTGVVLLKSANNFIWDYGHKGINLQVFDKGIEVSNFMLPGGYYFYYYSIKFVNTRIFGTARCSSPIYFFEWDIQGNEIRKIEINGVFRSTDNIATKVTEDSCILYPRFSQSEDKTLAVFIFNLAENTYRNLAFKLNISALIVPDEIIQFNDTFILSFHYLKPNRGVGWINVPDPRDASESCLYIMDSNTGLPREMPDWGELAGMIRTVIVKRNLIVLSISADSGPDVVKCFKFEGNRLVKTHTIKELPFIYNSTPALCFHGSKLSIAYKTNSMSKWCYFDLDSLQMVQEIETLSHPDRLPIYSDHQLIIPHLAGVLIHDYRHASEVNNVKYESENGMAI